MTNRLDKAEKSPKPAENNISFTKRELQVLTLSAHGKKYHEISTHLSITEDTAKEHMDNARQKLGAINKTHAIALAISSGYIKL